MLTGYDRRVFDIHLFNFHGNFHDGLKSSLRKLLLDNSLLEKVFSKIDVSKMLLAQVLMCQATQPQPRSGL